MLHAPCPLTAHPASLCAGSNRLQSPEDRRELFNQIVQHPAQPLLSKCMSLLMNERS